MITTSVQRDKGSTEVTAKTLPCYIKRIGIGKSLPSI